MLFSSTSSSDDQSSLWFLYSTSLSSASGILRKTSKVRGLRRSVVCYTRNLEILNSSTFQGQNIEHHHGCRGSYLRATLLSRTRLSTTLTLLPTHLTLTSEKGKLRITEHSFEVPRDYSKPSSGTLRLFARSARKAEKPADPADGPDASKKLPWLLFLQGGPGFGCRSPQSNAWTTTMLDRGYQVLCLDQRGTGLSSPLSASVLALRGDDQVQANYLKSFRADSIVRDCEAVRQALTAEYPEEKRKWSVLGQSFGGFCCVTYLSTFPEGLKEVFLTGGLPPLVDHPDPVYERCVRKVMQRNEAYYQKFPEDVDRVKRIVTFLSKFGDSTVRLPSEGSLSARRFQQLGLLFGGHGGIDQVHGKSSSLTVTLGVLTNTIDLVLRASLDLDNVGHITRPTLSAIEQCQSFDEAIIYAILHEPIYCQG